MTKLNDFTILITGGTGYENDGVTLLIDTSMNYSMSYGPKLNTRRFYHGCGTFVSENQVFVIVAGNYPDSSNPRSSELWNPGLDQWIEGPDLPQDCSYPSMVTSPNGQGVMLVGCVEHAQVTDTIYELVATNDTLVWRPMDQNLTYPRMNSVSVLVSDEFCIPEK